MRTKQTSYALQRHRKTFHLARSDPERWEEEKETTRLESLHEARERASAAEKEAETNKRLLEHSQQQASVVIVHEDEPWVHRVENKPISRRRDWRLSKPHRRVYARQTLQSLTSS